MLMLKKSAFVFLVVPLLVILLTGTVFADNEVDFKVTNVYYEDNDRIVKIKYSEAVEDAGDRFFGDSTLYEEAVKRIERTLLNRERVWVEVDIEDETYFLKYDEIVGDNKSLFDLVEDIDDEDNEKYIEDDDDYVEDNQFNFTHIMEIEAGEAVFNPVDAADWLVGVSVSPVELISRWKIDIEVDFGEVEEADGWQGIFDGDEDSRLRLKGTYIAGDGSRRSATLDPERNYVQVEDDPSGGELRLIVKDTKNYPSWEEHDTLEVTQRDVQLVFEDNDDTVTYTWRGREVEE